MAAENAQCHAGIRNTGRKWNFAVLVGGKMKTKALTAYETVHELTAWLDKQGIEPGTLHLCIDAADEQSEGFAYALHDSGVTISMVERAAVEAFTGGSRAGVTSPAAQAIALARYCAGSNPAAWVPPPPEERLLEAAVDSLAAYRKMQDMERKNRDAFRRDGMEDLALSVEEHLEWMDGAIARIDEEIAGLLEQHPYLREKMQDGAIPAAGTVRPAGG